MLQLTPAALFFVALAPGGAAPTQDARPVFKDGEAQIVDAFKDSKEWLQESLWVETEFDSDRDGELDRVYVDVTRPGQTATEGLKVPAVYETSPYYWGVSGADSSFFWDPNHEIGATPPERPSPPEIERPEFRALNSRSYIRQFVPRGFAMVHSASPGTGYSEGCPTIGGMNEALAPKAVIDWLNGRAKGFTTIDGDEEIRADWCTGKVGMIGTSYNGTLPLAAATTGVEGLEAIIPVAPNTSYYHYYRSNGLVRHPGGYMGEDIDVLYDFVHSGDPAGRANCNQIVREDDMERNQDRVTGDYNDFWAGRDYGNQLDKVKAAVLMAHGFNDWNVMPEHSVRIYEALKAKGLPTMCYYHQGGHGGDPPLSMVNKWFTHYLYGVPNDVDDMPRAWIVREDAAKNEPTPYADYPNPNAAPVTLRPSGDGNAIGTLSMAAGTGTEDIVDARATLSATHAMAAESKSRLLFASPVLEAPVHLSGHYEVKLRVASSTPAANLSVYLVSLPWVEDAKQITQNLISRGWADPQNAKSIRESEPLKPGQFVDQSFQLMPDDQIIPVGEQIGLMIFCTDPEFTLQPKDGTVLSVDLAGSSISLPVVGGEAAWKAAIGK
ncbi:Xaa-Pro dipeptidyl-peptidase [Planctomycetes bacterium Poly30]|uniref:Xaa-Pro dipeptidyl-peptidase n=1 Tax=Saltatorellus ferox TaxID=2528018 RepID=A0A518EXD6_9BACT|nr:Xaa-Pro dipeptidyl-peptidase [Planctomycetes bacterium Poly30]